MKFTGKNIVVFGGASGIGEASVKYFRENGATVFILDKAAVDDKYFMQCDITSLKEIETCLQKIGTTIDVVVNCVGIYSRKQSLNDFSEEEILNIISTNLLGAMYISRTVMTYLEKTKGNLLHVSSSLSLIPERESPIYCATKAGLNMFVKSLALSAADKGVRVNAVCPGPINTSLLSNSFPNKNELDKYLQSRPIKRAGEPNEVASLIGFLCSEESSYITGGIYTIDGGESLL